MSAFLVELATLLPKIVLPHLSVLLPHLGAESHVMRSALVQVIGQLILGAFDDTDPDKPLSRTRDQLLDILLLRTRDQSSFVRTKTLQTWRTVVEARKVPLAVWPELTPLVTGRCEDKNVHVRKNALELLSVFLKCNPYSPILSLSAIQAKIKSVEEAIGVSFL